MDDSEQNRPTVGLVVSAKIGPLSLGLRKAALPVSGVQSRNDQDARRHQVVTPVFKAPITSGRIEKIVAEVRGMLGPRTFVLGFKNGQCLAALTDLPARA